MAARVARQDDNKPGFSPDDGARGGADQDRDTTAAATASTDCQAPDRESTNGMAIKLFSHHRFRYGLLDHPHVRRIQRAGAPRLKALFYRPE
jgi:hypothetical protein